MSRLTPDVAGLKQGCGGEEQEMPAGEEHMSALGEKCNSECQAAVVLDRAIARNERPFLRWLSLCSPTGPMRPALTAILALLLAPGVALAGPWSSPPPLPPPSGAVVTVSTLAQLRNAVAAIASDTTIVIAPGTYALTSPLYINGSFTNVGIRGATGNRDDVVLVGKGMSGPNDGGTPFGIWVGGNVRGVTIADLTIRDIYNHPIMLNAGAQSPLIHNVRLVNAGQQFVKASPDGAGGGVDNGIVEYSVIEYETTSRDDYTNGVDVHTGDNWIIRHNLFRNVRAPQGLAGPAILMWNASTNTWWTGTPLSTASGEIALGLIERTPNDHAGGIVRNNFSNTVSSVRYVLAGMIFESWSISTTSGVSSCCRASSRWRLSERLMPARACSIWRAPHRSPPRPRRRARRQHRAAIR